jgi:hypothetical protein
VVALHGEGRLGFAGVPRERGSGPWGGLRPTALGAKGAREEGEAHRRAVEAGDAAERGRRRRPAAGRIGLPRGGVLPRLSGLLITRDRCVEIL